MKEKLENADHFFVQDFDNEWDLYTVTDGDTELVHTFESLDDVHRFLTDHLGNDFAFTVFSKI